MPVDKLKKSLAEPNVSEAIHRNLLQLVPKENSVSPVRLATGGTRIAIWRYENLQLSGGEWMRKIIQFLDQEECALLQQWTDAAIAIFSSALLVEVLKDIIGLLFG
jgi:hypothetical protein